MAENFKWKHVNLIDNPMLKRNKPTLKLPTIIRITDLTMAALANIPGWDPFFENFQECCGPVTGSLV